jgi:hypothetical protein
LNQKIAGTEFRFYRAIQHYWGPYRDRVDVGTYGDIPVLHCDHPRGMTVSVNSLTSGCHHPILRHKPLPAHRPRLPQCRQPRQQFRDPLGFSRLELLAQLPGGRRLGPAGEGRADGLGLLGQRLGPGEFLCVFCLAGGGMWKC